VDLGLDLSLNIQVLNSFAATGTAVRLTGLAGGLVEIASEWERHIEESEKRLFPRLVARGSEADGPVGFCLAEHAALSARLADLMDALPTVEWLREAEVLVGRLIHHVLLEAHVLRPLLDGKGIAYGLDNSDHRREGREER